MKQVMLALTFGLFLVVGLPLAASAGPTPGGADTDGDTVEDAFDNCTAVGNAGQEDVDHDGCGDACDPQLLADANNDLVVDFNDYLIMATEWGNTCVPGPTRSDANGDTVVDFNDYLVMAIEWGQGPPGPSGISNPSRDWSQCP